MRPSGAGSQPPGGERGVCARPCALTLGTLGTLGHLGHLAREDAQEEEGDHKSCSVCGNPLVLLVFSPPLVGPFP
jgi:hypothetical protein